MSYSIPRNEPVAIVGSSCRFAGGISKPSELWELLKNPKDLSQTIPPGRFSASGFFHSDGEYHGTTNSTKAYFLQDDHRAFDASFFGITPKEAEAIDPQQRMLLEVVYESLESAGYTLKQYSGKKVSVFSGVMTADYDTLCQRDDITSSQYFATGNARSIISNRLSYFFNFCGPSMTIDTACSASMVALHQAVQSLRSGESIMACVTGSNLILTPEQFITESSLHMLSPTGHCRMWDADADGYSRGEGIAALLLKPLSRALADGDYIQAIIRETGVNSDGRTQGITMPNPLAQATLIRDTYHKTGLDPTDPSHRCQYFEAHGTGTQAGDPREAQAIATAFFPNNLATHQTSVVTDQDAKHVAQNLLVGSVKTVIGHTEGAAGLAGVLKVVQAMREKTVPPNMHLHKLNPSVEPFYKNLEISTSCVPWPAPASGNPLRASVNSFGFGGTNSHAIIELYTPEIHDPISRYFAHSDSAQVIASSEFFVIHETPVDIQLPLVLSASSKKTLYRVALAYKNFMSLPDIYNKLSSPEKLVAFLYSLFNKRTSFPYKLSVTGATCQDFIKALEKAINEVPSGGPQEIGTLGPKQISQGPLKILGIFTGQGAQWAQMSKDLLVNCTTYRQTIQYLDQVLSECSVPPDWTLEQELNADPENSRVNIAAISQPLCTAVQIALVDLLRSIGVAFHTVVGHSSGEIGAAYAAAKITARDAILIAYFRGLCAHFAGTPESGNKGGMLAAGVSKLEAERLCSLDAWSGRLAVAASNSHTSVTLSGDLDAVNEMAQYLTNQGTFARVLMVDTAYHSAHMLAPAVQYGESLGTCNIEAFEGNNVIWVSSVYGDDRRLEVHELTSTYWTDNMVKPVLFREAIEQATSQDNLFDVVVEVGPHPALKGPATETIKAATGSAPPYFGILDRKKNDMVAFSDFIASMWTLFGSSAVDLPILSEANSVSTSQQQSWSEMLPTYPWDHSQIHYRESRISQQYHFRTDPPHELLGIRTRDDTEFELRWRNIIKMETIPWIEHHRFQGQALMPASAYCVMALDAARVLLKGKHATIIELQNLEFMSGITAEPGNYGIETLFTLTVLSPSKDRRNDQTITATFTLTSAYADGSSPMRMNFRGGMKIILGKPTVAALPHRASAHPETTSVSPEGFYRMMKDLDLEYTGPFQGIKTIDRRYNFASTTLLKSHPEDSTNLAVSPATLDTCFQACFSAFASPGDRSLWTTFLPTLVSKMRFNMAVCDLKGGQNQTIKVDASLTEFKPTSKEGAATINADMAIYNEQGQMEVQIEAMTVASFAATKPEDDYELYLHTVVKLDPEDTIISPKPTLNASSPEFRMLAESCDRVAAFFRQGDKSWPQETRDGLKAFVQTSPHSDALELLMQLGKNLPQGVFEAMTGPIMQEALDLLSMQQHIAAIVGQITHSYPRMNVLVVTEPGIGLKEHVLAGLGSSFTSLTLIGKVEASFNDKVLKAVNQGVRNRIITKDLAKEEEQWGKHDLVVMSTFAGGDSVAILKRMHALMNPGAFLLLVDVSTSPLKERLRRCAGLPVDSSLSNLTPPDWPDVLEECGFVNGVKNGDHHNIPGFAITVRQTESPLKDVFRNPLAGGPGSTPLATRLLIIGGLHKRSSSLLPSITTALGPFCMEIVTAISLEDAQEDHLATCTAAIILADLDQPVLSSMTASRLDNLRTLMRPETSVLWVTIHARDFMPEHAATFGFARTLLAEIPELNLQMLDLDTLRGAGQIIAENFGRLCHRKLIIGKNNNMLWSHEPEIHIEKGRRLIPRMLPYRPAIDRVNAPRRLVTSTVNTVEQCVEIVPVAASANALRYEIKIHRGIVFSGYFSDHPRAKTVSVQVLYSSSQPLNIGDYKGYLCVGRELMLDGKGRPVVLISQSNASIIQATAGQMLFEAPETAVSSHGFIAWVLRTLGVMSGMDKPQDGTIILVEPDMCLYKIVTELFTSPKYKIAVITADQTIAAANPGWTYVHRYQSRGPLENLFARVGKLSVYDFLEESSEVSNLIRNAVSGKADYYYYSGLELLTCSITEMRNSFEDMIEYADMKATELHPSCDQVIAASTITVPNFLDSTSPASSPFQVLDWRADRIVSHVAPHTVGTNMLSPDKTYLLVGITRDLGQSLCQLFADQGARHIVLASRSPPDAAQTIWRQELLARTGCSVLMEKLDVTDRDSVSALKSRISSTCPPVAGVVNGAMVLDDRVFSQMSIETLHRVMRPKTIGSSNLDVVFDSPDLDFFIMTSSFAAIGGHAGQANYAAANMYMNGLAGDRRRRGLAASVLNIGVVYGLGFLHREKDDLYRGLEREGYPPISERDVHHMFLEAVAAGRSREPGVVADLTTGLSRYSTDDAEPLHWHRDPRFSHYTIQQAGREVGGAAKITERQSIKDKMEVARTAAEVQQVIAAGLEGKLRSMLQLHEGAALDAKMSLSDLGVDSLAANEIRSWVFKNVGKDVAILKILGAASVEKLCEEISGMVVAGRK